MNTKLTVHNSAKSFIFILVTAFSFNAFADEAADMSQSERDAACGVYEQLANATMSLRQNGVPLREAMEFLGDSESQLLRRIIVEAYEVPRFNAEPTRQRAITDYSDKVYLDCLRAVDK